MSRFIALASIRTLGGALVALALLGSDHASAQDAPAGQADLDAATQMKLNAQSMADLERVVELCESALEKGLDDQSGELAKSLMTATLHQHAMRFSRLIFDPRERSPRWPILKQFAIDDLDKALKYRDDLPEVHLLLARLEALPRGDADKGRRSADRAVELFADDKPSLANALVVRAGYQQDVEQRFADLTRAIELDPANADAWRVRGLTHLARSQQLAREQKLDEAKRERDQALDDFLKLLESNPQDQTIQQAVAELLAGAGNFDEALTHLESALELNPASPIPYRLRAGIYRRQEKLDLAVQDLNRAIDLKPDDAASYLERSSIHFQRGDLGAARSDIDRALEIKPDNLQAVLQRSLLASFAGQFPEAIRDLQRVMQVSTDPRLQIQLGNIYVRAKQPSKAIEVFTEVLEREADNELARRGRADAYLSVGKQSEAVADYESAYAVAPEDDGILNNLAWVLATSPHDNLRDAKRAIELATKACEVTEYKQAHILSTLAAAYAEAGDFDKAVEWSSKAVELDQGQLEQLRQELESYQQKKPWRELQETEEETVEPPQDDDLKPLVDEDGEAPVEEGATEQDDDATKAEADDEGPEDDPSDDDDQ